MTVAGFDLAIASMTTLRCYCVRVPRATAGASEGHCSRLLRIHPALRDLDGV